MNKIIQKLFCKHSYKPIENNYFKLGRYKCKNCAKEKYIGDNVAFTFTTPPQKAFFVRIINRRKIGRGWTETIEIKAFSTEEKAVKYIEERGLVKNEESFYKDDWRKVEARGKEGWQAFLTELDIN
jgi:hypothetical protein